MENSCANLSSALMMEGREEEVHYRCTRRCSEICLFEIIFWVVRVGLSVFSHRLYYHSISASLIASPFRTQSMTFSGLYYTLGILSPSLLNVKFRHQPGKIVIVAEFNLQIWRVKLYIKLNVNDILSAWSQMPMYTCLLQIVFNMSHYVLSQLFLALKA